MNSILLFACFLFVQDAAKPTPVAPAAAVQMVDVRVQMIGLKQGFEIPEQVLDPAEFLKDARTLENMLWSRDFRVSAMPGKQVVMNTGENIPMVIGYSMAAQGRKVPQVTRQQTGTIVRFTPRLENKDRILLKLYIENSRLDRGEADPAAAEPEAVEDALLRQAIRQMIFESEVFVLNGKTKSFSSSQSSASPKNPAEQALILITARVVDD